MKKKLPQQEKKQPGPIPIKFEGKVAPFFIRDFPVHLRMQARAKAHEAGITFREWLVRILTKEVTS